MEEEKTLARISVDQKLIYDRLIEVKPGEVITYETLNAVIGSDITKKRYILQSARNMAERENQIVFDCISKVGLKRLDATGVIGTGEAEIVRIRRRSKKVTNRMLSCVSGEEFKSLPNEQKIKHNTYASIFGAISYIGSGKVTQMIESKVSQKMDMLSLQQTLAAFQ